MVLTPSCGTPLSVATERERSLVKEYNALFSAAVEKGWGRGANKNHRLSSMDFVSHSPYAGFCRRTVIYLARRLLDGSSGGAAGATEPSRDPAAQFLLAAPRVCRDVPPRGGTNPAEAGTFHSPHCPKASAKHRHCGTGPRAVLPDMHCTGGCYPLGVPLLSGRSSHLRSSLRSETSVGRPLAMNKRGLPAEALCVAKSEGGRPSKSGNGHDGPLRRRNQEIGLPSVTKRVCGMEPLRGFEPRTYRLQGGCSTTELKRHRSLLSSQKNPNLPTQLLPSQFLRERQRHTECCALPLDALELECRTDRLRCDVGDVKP